MSNFIVDTERCTKDYICVKECPRNIITINKKTGFPYIDKESENLCIQCGHCVINCASRANKLSFFPDSQIDTVNIDLMPLPHQSEVLLKTRRSVRQFKDKIIDDNHIEKILDIAKYAPTASNRQSVRWIIVKQSNTTKELSKLYNQGLRDFLRHNTEDEFYKRHLKSIQQGLDPVFRGARQLAIAIVPNGSGWVEDAIIALTYFEIAAHSMSIGTCWCGYLMKMMQLYAPMREKLGILDSEHICGILLIGYPVLKTSKMLPPRKKQDITIK